MGALVTDFTLIKAGSLHKANGGFLVLHIEDLLQHPNAWEGLLRALRSNQARIEDTGDTPDTAIRTKGITPEPLALDLKVVLIGGEELYETLLVNDDRFAKLFRIKAHMADVTERTAENIRIYLSHIARIIDENGLRPFDRTALAWLVDLGSHLCEDQRRLSLKFPLLRELMIEAAALAEMRQLPLISHPGRGLRRAHLPRQSGGRDLHGGIRPRDDQGADLRFSRGAGQRPFGHLARGFRIRPAAPYFLHCGRGT